MVKMFEFPHVAPHGYSYEISEHKRNVVAIWICNHGKFSYTQDTPKSIWGFYNTKLKKYYSPVNAKTVGKVVDIDNTTPYSAMQILKPMRPSVLSFV
jgi:hypothetical protein